MTIQQVVFRIKTVVAEDGASAIERIHDRVRKLMGQKPNGPLTLMISMNFSHSVRDCSR